MRAFLRHSALSVFFLALFLLTLAGQSFAGWHQVNASLVAEHLDPMSWPGYVTSSDFAVDVAENWQSEFLAVLALVVLTIFLRQKGSPQSKPVDAPHGRTGE